MRLFMYRHGPSAGGRALARRVGARLIRLHNSRYVYRPGHLVLNWGASEIPDVPHHAVINNPVAVGIAQSKRHTYDALKEAGIATCEYTVDWNVAHDWLYSGYRVIHRTLDRGSQGRGMTVYSRDGTEYSLPIGDFEAIEPSGFYVKVFGDVRSNVEYRIHVMDGRVIDRQQKRRRSNNENGSHPYVRSSSNGWVFCREGLDVDGEVDKAAIEAVKALGLDFGAVDLARSARGEVCVYEVNTAPGLENTTLDSYGEAIEEYARGKRT